MTTRPTNHPPPIPPRASVTSQSAVILSHRYTSHEPELGGRGSHDNLLDLEEPPELRGRRGSDARRNSSAVPSMDAAAASAWAATTDKIVYFFNSGEAKPELLDKLDSAGLEAETIEEGFNATRYRSKTLASPAR